MTNQWDRGVFALHKQADRVAGPDELSHNVRYQKRKGLCCQARAQATATRGYFPVDTVPRAGGPHERVLGTRFVSDTIRITRVGVPAAR